MILLSPEKIQEALFAEAKRVGVPKKYRLPTTDMNYHQAIAKAQAKKILDELERRESMCYSQCEFYNNHCETMCTDGCVWWQQLKQEVSGE